MSKRTNEEVSKLLHASRSVHQGRIRSAVPIRRLWTQIMEYVSKYSTRWSSCSRTPYNFKRAFAVVKAAMTTFVFSLVSTNSSVFS